MKLPLILSALCIGAISVVGARGATAPGWTSVAQRCVALGPLPDPLCTPGAVETTDLAVICGQSTRERRHVTAVERREVFAEYGIPFPSTEEYEVDHLVPLCAGGSNDIGNLWPQAADPPPGFHEKDRLEQQLCHQVCAGRMTPADAQHLIATDWVLAYDAMIGDGGR